MFLVTWLNYNLAPWGWPAGSSADRAEAVFSVIFCADTGSISDAVNCECI